MSKQSVRSPSIVSTPPTWEAQGKAKVKGREVEVYAEFLALDRRPFSSWCTDVMAKLGKQQAGRRGKGVALECDRL